MLKRIIAGCLAVIMTGNLLLAMPLQAEETHKEVIVYDLEETKASLLNGEEKVTFPISAAAINMGEELVYHLFRQGNTEKEQTVTLGTMDLTAAYGEDYEIIYEGKVIDGKANKMMAGEGTTYNVYLGENVLESEGSGDNASASEELSAEEQKEELLKCISSSWEVTFQRGEAVKEIRIRSYLPKEAVGNKEMQLTVLELGEKLAEGEYISTAVTLAESREVEESEISIKPDSEAVVDGYVTVLVERKGNTAGYTEYSLQTEDGTAKNGEDFVLGTTKLMFSPGVSRQRVHIPLVASEEKTEKTFTLRTGDSEEEITYTPTLRGVTFTKTREYIDIPMSEFQKAGSTIGSFTYKANGGDETPESRYRLEFDSKIGAGENRSASIRSKQQYDFTGIEKIRISASYNVGTILGDHLDVYASNTEYTNNKAALSQIESYGYGRRIDTLSLTGQGIHDINVEREGKYYIFMTAEQHDGFGHIAYNLYNEEFNGGSDGHTVLVKKKYQVEAVAPRNVGGAVMAGDVILTLSTDSSVTGLKLDAYRDESFQIGYKLVDSTSHYRGYQILNAAGEAIYTKYTESPVFHLDSEIINQCGSKISDNTFRIRPIIEPETASVKILPQDFAAMGMEGLSVNIDEKNSKAIFREGADEIATVSWNTTEFVRGKDVQFTVKENASYTGDYHFTAYKVSAGSSEELSLINPVYYTDPSWSMSVSEDCYEITPMVSNINARFYLNVEGASHGNFVGKPSGFTGDTYQVKELDGHYDVNDIATFWARPAEGYRAKWSYRDVETGTTKIYHGNSFYYRLQFPVILTDNYVTLEFEKVSKKESMPVLLNVYMQAGNVLHEPIDGSASYEPVKSGNVSLEGTTRPITGTYTGSTGTFYVDAVGDEIFTALVLVNNRYYIEDVNMEEAAKNSMGVDLKLSYYYDGPRVTAVQYYDMDGSTQNGDTIFLADETDSVILGAKVHIDDEEVTDVLYKLKSADGVVKQEVIAERNGSEYIWAANLGLMAQEGDEIWIEIVNRTTDDNGNVIKQISYGEVNTGYSIVISEYNDASYLPDTGFPDEEFNVPLFGNMNFLFNVKGLRPIFTTSRSGNIIYLNMGVNAGGSKSFIGEKKWSYNSWETYKKTASNGMKLFSLSAKEDETIAAKQALKKNMITFNVSVTVQLALYNTKNAETENSELLCVGVYFGIGFNTTYIFNMPFTIEGIPMFLNLSVSGGLSDTIQVSPAMGLEYVDVREMHDPTKSTYKPENDFQLPVSLGILVGVGVNGFLDVAGGGTGKITLDWIDFTSGKGVISVKADLRVEFFLAGKTFSANIADYTMFDTTSRPEDVLENQGQEALNMQILQTKLRDMKVEVSAGDSQKLHSSSMTNGGNLITDAYEYSKPAFVNMGNGRYMIVATVSPKFIDGLDAEKTYNNGILGFAIYDSLSDKWLTGDKKEQIFESLEPKQNIGDSMNFHPSICALGSGKYAITWNSVLSDTDEELTLKDLRPVIKTAIYDSESPETGLIYKSLVTADKSQNFIGSVALKTVYDEDDEQLILLYRSMNTSDLDENSTLEKYGKIGTTLSCTSLDVSDKALTDTNTTFTESVEIASGGGDKILKTADIGMLEGNPICTYHVTEGEQASLLGEAEEGSTNHIYLTRLSGKKLSIEKQIEVTKDSNKEYNATPQILEGMLMWKQEERMAAVDVNSLLEDEKNYFPKGVSALVNEQAGHADDYQLIKGEDGRVYAMWTEGNYTENASGELSGGSRLMMAAMEKVGNGEQSIWEWGKGTTVLTTTDDRYIQHYTACVDANSQLKLLYRETKFAKDSEQSNIGFETISLASKLTILKDTIEVSNGNPKRGETITIHATVRNDGVKKHDSFTLPLLTNGEKTSSVRVPDLQAGEETEVTFRYTMPEKADERVTFTVGDSKMRAASFSISTGTSLEIQNLKFKQLNYPEEGSENPVYKFKVIANVKNTGGSPVEESSFLLSYLELAKFGEEDVLKETVISEPVEIPELDPEEDAQIEFEIEVGQDLNGDGKSDVKTVRGDVLFPVAAAVYTGYGSDSQAMWASATDYMLAEPAPEAQTVTSVKSKQVGVGQKLLLPVGVEPLNARIHTSFTYTSSNPEIAQVDASGIITGKKVGECIVTIMADNDPEKTFDVKVTVTKEAVPEDGTIPDTHLPDNPESSGGSPVDTGDNKPIWQLSFLLGISTAVIVAVIGKKRNKQ